MLNQVLTTTSSWPARVFLWSSPSISRSKPSSNTVFACLHNTSGLPSKTSAPPPRPSNSRNVTSSSILATGAKINKNVRRKTAIVSSATSGLVTVSRGTSTRRAGETASLVWLLQHAQPCEGCSQVGNYVVLEPHLNPHILPSFYFWTANEIELEIGHPYQGRLRVPARCINSPVPIHGRNGNTGIPY